MSKKILPKLTSLLLVMILAVGIFPTLASASASSVHITSFTSTTKANGMGQSNYHHFYSSKSTVQAEVNVDKWIRTKSIKKLHVELQKSNGMWWSTQDKKTLTSTKKVKLSASAGTGDYRLVVYDEHERNPHSNKQPLYYFKSTQYSASVWGL